MVKERPHSSKLLLLSRLRTLLNFILKYIATQGKVKNKQLKVFPFLHNANEADLSCSFKLELILK